VLLVVSLPVLVAAAYVAGVRGQLLITGAVTLAIPSVLVVVATHLFPSLVSHSQDHPSGRQLDRDRSDAAGTLSDRAYGLVAVADVARATTSVLDPSVLLPQVVDLVRDRFDLYYVGLFLVDEERQFATLAAGTGPAGRQMLANHHRLEVGGRSMIGQCVATGKPGVHLDVGAAAVRFDNPLLPKTHSELALPLRARDHVIGALSVQSEKPDAFGKPALELLQTMADQVAVAIDNARLFAESRAALREMQLIQQRYTLRGWQDYLSTQDTSATITLGAPGLDESVVASEIGAALASGAATVIPGPTERDGAPSREGHTALVLPVSLRNGTIGAVGVHADADREWSKSDILLAQAVVERFASAAENLRLIDETQRRAARERLTRQIGQQVREAPDLGEIMHTAAEVLGQELGASEVVVRLGTADKLLALDGGGVEPC
jgi:GAF domain-containing protein